jgi:hypothetical protein
MEEIQVSKTALVAKYAVLTAAMLIVYFLIMSLFGLTKYSALRVINYPLIALGIFSAINEIKRKSGQNKIGYLTGFSTGFMIVLATAILFSIFVFIYARAINTSFVNMIWPDPYSKDNDTNSVAIGMYIFGETLIFGLIIDFIAMQYFKRDGGSTDDED